MMCNDTDRGLQEVSRVRLRLEADCRQLAAVVHTHALQSNFLRMASIWSTLADRGPDAHSASIEPSETTAPSA